MRNPRFEHMAWVHFKVWSSHSSCLTVHVMRYTFPPGRKSLVWRPQAYNASSRSHNRPVSLRGLSFRLVRAPSVHDAASVEDAITSCSAQLLAHICQFPHRSGHWRCHSVLPVLKGSQVYSFIVSSVWRVARNDLHRCFFLPDPRLK